MIVNLVFFSDINECELPEINCDMNAQCVNTDGSFDCTCNPGYFGNGTTCGKPSIASLSAWKLQITKLCIVNYCMCELYSCSMF